MDQCALRRSVGAGIAMAVGVGTALGVALHNVAEGVGLAAAIGLVLGLAVYRRKLKQATEKM